MFAIHCEQGSVSIDNINLGTAATSNNIQRYDSHITEYFQMNCGGLIQTSVNFVQYVAIDKKIFAHVIPWHQPGNKTI